MFCGFIMTGQVIFTMGITYKTYLLCLFGRFVFGLGGESLTVAQNTYTVRWFEGKTLALCFGLVVAFARIGSSINFVVTPRLAAIGVPLAAWVGAGTCVLSFVACICLALLDRYGNARAKVNANAESPVQLRDLKRFPVSAWFLWMICGFFYVAVLSFYTVASAILQNVGHKYSPETATLFLSIPNFVSIVFSPLFGALVDRVGRALTFIMVASVMLACGHVGFLANAMEWVQISPILLMLWVGLSYSLGAASIWPILGLVVEDRILSTGYGMMTALQNLFLAVFPMLIGALQDKKGIAGTKLQYTLPLMIFIGTSGIAFVLAFLLLGIDKAKHNGVMNSSAGQRAEIKRKAAELADKI
jgi:MFS family permease